MRQPSICLNMIVRNEAAIIRDTLENVTRIVPLSTWVIHDTGSEDGTPAIIEAFFREKDIPGELIHRRWENFAANRQYALESATGKSDYVLFIDADSKLDGVFPGLAADCTADSCEVFTDWGSSKGYLKPIVRNDGCFHWRGIIHEGLYFKGAGEKVHRLPDSFRLLNRSAGALSQDSARYYRDAILLTTTLAQMTKDGEAHPDYDLRARYTFYAANSWRDAKAPREAIPLYRDRIAQGGSFRDEIYMAHVNLGQALRDIGDREEAIRIWLAGQDICADRAECIYLASQTSRMIGRPEMARVYALAGMAIPQPTGARLFLWPAVYRFWLAFEYLLALKDMNRMGEGRDAGAARDALQLMVENDAPEHLYRLLGMAR